VEGAFISAITDGDSASSLADDGTDAGGHYQLRLPSGPARLYFNSLPDAFSYPEPQIIKTLGIKPGQGDIESLDFTLRRRTKKG
jgi:hypothetical protein